MVRAPKIPKERERLSQRLFRLNKRRQMDLSSHKLAAVSHYTGFLGRHDLTEHPGFHAFGENAVSASAKAKRHRDGLTLFRLRALGTFGFLWLLSFTGGRSYDGQNLNAFAELFNKKTPSR